MEISWNIKEKDLKKMWGREYKTDINFTFESYVINVLGF